MKNKIKIIFTLILLFGLFQICSASFTVSPGTIKEYHKLNFSIKPEEEVTGSIAIFNYDDTDTEFQIYSVNTDKTDLGGISYSTPTADRPHPADWITPSKKELTLKAKESQNLDFKIKIPKGTPPGSYIMGLAVEPKVSEEINGGTGAISKLRISTAIYISVPGEKIINYKITNLSYNYLKKQFSFVFHNNGNAILKIQGTIKTSGFGSAETSLPLTETYIPGNEQSTISVPFYKVPSLLIGKATLNLKINEYDILNNKNILIEEKTLESPILILPIITIIIIVTIVIMIIVFILIKKYQLRKIIKNSSPYTIQENDSLTILCQHFNVNWKIVAKINKLKPPFELKKDSIILIPNNNENKQKNLN